MSIFSEKVTSVFVYHFKLYGLVCLYSNQDCRFSVHQMVIILPVFKSFQLPKLVQSQLGLKVNSLLGKIYLYFHSISSRKITVFCSEYQEKEDYKYLYCNVALISYIIFLRQKYGNLSNNIKMEQLACCTHITIQQRKP